MSSFSRNAGRFIAWGSVTLAILGAGEADAAKKSPPLNDKAASAANCLDCHSDIGEGKVVHKPIKGWGCYVCHLKDTKGKGPVNPNLPDDHVRVLKIDKDSIGPICLQCHDKVEASLKKAKFKHTAMDMGCASCHKPHTSEHPKLLTMKQSPDLCVSCHDTFKTPPKGSIVHEPFGDSTACANCHTAHVSTEKGLLSSKPQELCLGCHASEVEGLDKRQVENISEVIEKAKSKHQPVADGECMSCHNPHFTPEKRLLKKAFQVEFHTKYSEAGNALCWDCHSGDLAKGPESTDTEFRNGKKNLHYLHLVGVAKTAGCTACHDVHGATQPKLIDKNPKYHDKKIFIEFTKTASGGTCATACHGAKTYDREKPATNKAGR